MAFVSAKLMVLLSLTLSIIIGLSQGARHTSTTRRTIAEENDGIVRSLQIKPLHQIFPNIFERNVVVDNKGHAFKTKKGDSWKKGPKGKWKKSTKGPPGKDKKRNKKQKGKGKGKSKGYKKSKGQLTPLLVALPIHRKLLLQVHRRHQRQLPHRCPPPRQA